MFWIPLLLLRIFALFSWFEQVYGFDFVVSSLTQCGVVRFTWVGGTPPFRALIIPPGGSIKDVSIPANSWNDKDQSGDFSTILQLSAGTSVMFSMADATGITAGGVTDLMTVGPPTAGSQSCNTSDPGTDFTYNLDGTLSQCKPYPFTGYTGAVQPVTILVAVPHGESFLLHPPGGDTFNWLANITAGTSVTFSMTDAQNRIGGSVIRAVGPSDDSSCLQSLPSSAPPTRIPTPTSPSSPTNTHGNGDSDGSNGNQKNDKTGVIIGASVGGAVALLILVALVYFLCKGRRRLDAFDDGRRIDLTEPGPDSSTFLLDPQQQGQYPPVNPYSQYQDGTTPQAGPTGAPLAMGTTYNNTSLNDPRGMGVPVGAAPMGAAAAMWANQQLDPTMGTNQWGAMARQQQYPPQQYYDPYEMGSGSSVAGASSTNHPSLSGRPVSQAVSDGKFGVDSASNYSASVGPSAISKGQSGKRLSSGTQPSRRLIVHTDIEDEPIELPPMYSESRGPISGMH